MTGHFILSLLLWLPIAGGLLVLAAGRVAPGAVRWLALLTALVTFAVSVPLWTQFDTTTAAMQFTEKLPWISTFNVYYALGVDGISMPLILLTTFVTILVVVAGWEVIQYKTAQYMAAFLILEGLMDGVFSATDGMLFYVLWEAMLIPMFLIIGVWGGPRRVYATIKFFLYTFLGSVFMLVAIVYMYLKAGSFDIQAFQQLPLGLQPQVLIFIAFLLAFAVKVPMWPVHTWLPDAHVEAPTGGSVILAAIMLKMGGYGFLRFSLPITPDASHALTWLVIGLSLTAIVYIGFVAIVQTDMKKLVAYSSVAHMGFVTLGFFLLFAIFEKNASLDGTVMGVEGGMVQMISHGFISGALFLCVGVLYDRLHTREIGAYGGVVNVMPAFAFFMVLFAMANCGLPGTSGFVGEWMVILAAMRANFWVAFAAAFTLFLGAAYSLWLVKRVLYGPVGNDHVRGMTDISQREFVVLGLCAVPVIVLGVWPAPLLDVMHATVTNLVHQVAQTKLTGG
ncbi:MAG TPA: NADH-quinone oxidoreductase subunit M [Gammaproteobacteria bacterium]|jgi:NADH-quinone oxidoreductase subunit M|nr:NADH-quinone oxidoreductase subunit M [Gammaproteobacteria bacterium]